MCSTPLVPGAWHIDALSYNIALELRFGRRRKQEVLADVRMMQSLLDRIMKSILPSLCHEYKNIIIICIKLALHVSFYRLCCAVLCCAGAVLCTYISVSGCTVLGCDVST